MYSYLSHYEIIVICLLKCMILTVNFALQDLRSSKDIASTNEEHFIAELSTVSEILVVQVCIIMTSGDGCVYHVIQLVH